MIKTISILWKFSRPHTIIGSVVSITALWLMTLQVIGYENHLSLLWWTLLVGVTCNIFIVGLNQIMDVELDKINKPNLPLANGSLTLRDAYIIILTCLAMALVFSFMTSIILGWLIVVILTIGVAYSVPPVQLKTHHLPAAFAITTVRGILVNLGMFLHFIYSSGQLTLDQIMVQGFQVIPGEIWMLTSFVVAFSIAIAWFKDLPDMDGDAKFKFRTLALAYSPKVALYGGIFLVSAAYLTTLIWSFRLENLLLSIMHAFALVAFLINVSFINLSQPKTITRFYMIFWVFFFLEYIFFGISAIS